MINTDNMSIGELKSAHKQWAEITDKRLKRASNHNGSQDVLHGLWDSYQSAKDTRVMLYNAIQSR